MDNIMKRAGILVVTAVMAVGLCFGLAACGGAANNDEQLIKSELDKAFSTLKNPTEDSIKELAGDDLSNLDELKKYGVDPIEMMQHFFSKFDYTIDGVKVDGDKATASVTITNVDYGTVLNETVADLQNNQEFMSQAASVYVSEGEEGMYKLIFDEVYKAIDNSDKLATNSVDIALEKKDGQWDFTEQGQKDLMSAMFGGFDFSSL